MKHVHRVKVAKLLWNACVSSAHSSGLHGGVLTTETTSDSTTWFICCSYFGYLKLLSQLINQLTTILSLEEACRYNLCMHRN